MSPVGTHSTTTLAEDSTAGSVVAESAARPSFREAVGEVWAEPEARRFTIFVFVSMLAYSAQDLILEPFGGQVFGLSLGETTKLASAQHMGVFGGMILAALAGGLGGERLGSLRAVHGPAPSMFAASESSPGMPAKWARIQNTAKGMLIPMSGRIRAK